MNRGEEMKIWDLDLTAASGADKKWRKRREGRRS